MFVSKGAMCERGTVSSGGQINVCVGLLLNDGFVMSSWFIIKCCCIVIIRSVFSFSFSFVLENYVSKLCSVCFIVHVPSLTELIGLKTSCGEVSCFST